MSTTKNIVKKREKKPLTDNKETSKNVVKKRDKNTALIDDNVIFTADVKLGITNSFEKLNLNLNTVMVGDTGSGKSQFFVIPNVLNANTSYVITDPKAEILRSTGVFLRRMGYEIKVFNLIEMEHSNNYNPFAYVYDSNGKLDDTAVIKVINMIMKAKGGKDKKSGGADPFWELSAEKLLTAISILVLEEGKKSQKNLYTVAQKMRTIEFPSDPRDKDFECELDKEFRILEEHNPESLGVSLYKEVKQSSKRTLQSIIMVASSKIQDFNLKKIKNLTFCDNLNLEKIGDKKTAFFILIPDIDKTYTYLAGILYTQMFDLLVARAKTKYALNNNRLPVHIRFILDEFANTGKIPDFDTTLPMIRGYNMSACVILQALSQLKTMFEDSWETIYGGCFHSFLFLGGVEPTTLDIINKRLGKETIDVVAKNKTKAKQSSTSENNSIMGRELLTTDEISKIPTDKCILFVKGCNPFYSDKYNVKKHPNFRFSARANKKNFFIFDYIKTLEMPKTLTKTEERKRQKSLRTLSAGVNASVKAEAEQFIQKSIINNIYNAINDILTEKKILFEDSLSDFADEILSIENFEKGVLPNESQSEIRGEGGVSDDLNSAANGQAENEYMSSNDISNYG